MISTCNPMDQAGVKPNAKVCVKTYDETRYAERKDEIREQQKESRAPGGVQYETRKAYQDARNRAIRDLPNAAEVNKRNNLKRYNMTLEQYNELLEEQNHCCAGCGSINLCSREGFTWTMTITAVQKQVAAAENAYEVYYAIIATLHSEP